ncbi:BTAD domain-containing putative transcriptional regulator [Kitasatospora sp. GP82]|uniref:ATP-binding protein n=1 Tax=Kitasatospora sp. GP82 TaxID=3035089 RepID=UPI0024771C22|nr:BTAD domain-containing putative transcriptional regulator [Kitasatospora sp. GP82]MDH6126881.1 putative ATPase/DNA-binding SARP family transcriptional activator [Kitasatospora sp. GP82]
MVSVHYGILGTTTAHQDDGTPVPLGGARLRALLAALVLRQGRPVPAELLVDEVWGAGPPQDSSAALQTLVGRLRRTIGRDEVGSGPAGYWLTGRHTDLGEFQRLLAEGRQALSAADHALAAERMTAALGLWRGPALADLPDRSGPATRLEAQCEEARRHRIGAELELGRAAELTAELAELCAERPLDEQMQILLIRALHDSGRTAEALQQYERARRALAEQLGADPGAGLQALHRALLRSTAPEPAVARQPQPEPASAAPVSAAPARPVGNLRPRLTSFVGRESELTALKAALTAGRLTTLTGPGGSGKTRLSVEAGRAAATDGQAAAGSWPDGVWLAELAPLEDPADVPGAVLSALGLRETVLHTGGAVGEVARTEDPARRIVEHCAPRRMLLVLDNCEHLIQAAAELVDQLLAECPELTVLATSREPLGVPGEVVLPVEPLPDPVALRLLAERGAAARPGFDPAEDAAACAEICRRLDGLPLAIELAAARLRGLTPRQLADRLDGRFALLTAGSRTLLPRQQTLRAVVDWSWDLLGERERAVLRRLAVFAGGWTLEEAEQVCADDAEVPREEVADLLLSLVDKSLLVAGLGEETRYWMLETIHEYATERLAEAGDQQVALRHIHCFRELVRTAELNLHGPEQLHWLAVLGREQDNIRAALRRAVDSGEEQEALILALGMSWFWSLRDFRTEARGWYEAVAVLGPDPFADDAPEPVPLLVDPLEMPLPMSPELLQEARRQIHLHRLVSMFTGNMAMLGDPAIAELARRVLETYTPDLPQSFRYPALMRVFAAFLAGEMDQLRTLLDGAVDGCRRHGRDGDLAFILQIRSRMLNDWAGGLDEAVRDSDEALEIFTRAGDRWGISEALASQAENASKRGESVRAAEAYRRAIGLAQELGAPQEVPLLQVQLGETLFADDPEEGERLVRQALESIETGNRSADGAMLYGRMVLCSLHASRGEYAEALHQMDLLEQSQRSFGPLVPGIFRGIVASIRAWVVALDGDAERGVELLREARRMVNSVDSLATVFTEHMTVKLILPAVGVLARLAESRGDLRPARRAAVLLGAHCALHGERGSHLERQERERGDRDLRRLLGEDDYREAVADGGRLTLTEAAAMMNDPDGAGV